MESNPRVAAILALALLAGCSKALAPDTRIARDAAGRAAPQRGTVLKLTGSLVTLDAAFQPRVDRHVDFFVPPADPSGLVRDTVSAFSTLGKVQWGSASASATRGGDEPGTLPGGAPDPVTSGADVLAPGLHQLTFDAPARLGGGTVTFLFVVNFAPDTWWAGPDPSLWPASSDGDGRAVDVTDWSHFTTSPAWPPDGRGYFGPDSLSTIPSARRPVANDVERRTFYEIFGDRIYARSDGDAVHQNAWIVLMNGGYDKDSRYAPRVVAGDPSLPADFVPGSGRYPVLEDLGLAGSPIGFRLLPLARLADGSLLRFSESTLYPVIDPNSVFRQPNVAGYFRAVQPGKLYLVAMAADADGSIDRSVPAASVAEIADHVDAGGGTPAERLYRRKILVLNVRPSATQPM